MITSLLSLFYPELIQFVCSHVLHAGFHINICLNKCPSCKEVKKTSGSLRVHQLFYDLFPPCSSPPTPVELDKAEKKEEQ